MRCSTRYLSEKLIIIIVDIKMEPCSIYTPFPFQLLILPRHALCPVPNNGEQNTTFWTNYEDKLSEADHDYV